METCTSRLPRAASNPAIRAPSASSTNSSGITHPQPQSQAQAQAHTRTQPSRPLALGGLGKPHLSRQPSIPLRAGRVPPPSTAPLKEESNLPAPRHAVRRLLPSRSTLGLTGRLQPPTPARAADKPLGPKRTVSSARLRPTTASKELGNEVTRKVHGPSPLSAQRAINDPKGPRHAASSAESDGGAATRSLSSAVQPRIAQRAPSHTTSKTPKRETGLIAVGLGSRSRPTPTTPSGIPTSIFETPALPRVVSSWPNRDGDDDGDRTDEQLKDVELSFVDADGEESGDTSFVAPPDFGGATSRFVPSHSRKSTEGLFDQTWAQGGDGVGRAGKQGALAGESERRVRAEREVMQLRAESAARGKELAQLHAESMRNAWGEVVRAGQGDLEDVRSMLELARTLREDLDPCS